MGGIPSDIMHAGQDLGEEVVLGRMLLELLQGLEMSLVDASVIICCERDIRLDARRILVDRVLGLDWISREQS